MEGQACESCALLDFLGGHPDGSEGSECSEKADLKLVAHDGHTGEERTFCVCENCILQLMWLPQHPVGWIESTRPLRKAHSDEKKVLQKVAPAGSV